MQKLEVVRIDELERGSEAICQAQKIGYHLRSRAYNQPCRRRLPDEQVDLAVEVFRMLADGTRIRILWALIGRELSVDESAAQAGKPPAAVSQHLAKLPDVSTCPDQPGRHHGLLSAGQRARCPAGHRCIHNTEHAGPGVPGHHLADADLVRLQGDTAGA